MIGNYARANKFDQIHSLCQILNISMLKSISRLPLKNIRISNRVVVYVKEEIPKLTTLQSPIGKVMAYFSEREKQLGMFLHDGMLLMETNLIDNTIRPISLGRNNYLFAGSHDAAQIAAILYSLFATCKLHDVNAYEWLKYVLTVMPTFPASRIKELLPQNWSQVLVESALISEP